MSDGSRNPHARPTAAVSCMSVSSKAQRSGSSRSGPTCVKRLMQIADEVQKELQRQQPHRGSGGRIAKLLSKLVDLVDDAGPWRSGGGRDPGRKGRVAETG